MTLLDSNSEKGVGQKGISYQYRLPVDCIGTHTSYPVSAESLTFKYYDANGALQTDAGQAIGAVVVINLTNKNVLNELGDMIGSFGDSSFEFVTGTILTTEVPYRGLLAEQAVVKGLIAPLSGQARAIAVTAGFKAGEFCVDHEHGVIYGVKATTGSSDTANYTVFKTLSDSTGASTAQGTYNTTLPTLTNGQEVSLQLDDRGMLIVTLGRLIAGEDQTNGVLAVFQKPLPSITYASSVDQSTALETGSVIKNEAGNLFKLGGYIDATLGNGTYYLQICNSAAVGGTTFAMAPVKYIHASGTDTPVDIDCTPFGIHGSSGLVWQLSSNANPWSYTAAGAYGNITALYK